jgi:hypothetical protein
MNEDVTTWLEKMFDDTLDELRVFITDQGINYIKVEPFNEYTRMFRPIMYCNFFIPFYSIKKDG